MKCIEISKPGGPEVLVVAERATPAPKANEILVKVAAAGVNRPDVLQRMGKYPVPPDASDLPGLEIAGEIAALGSSATKFKVGDKVLVLDEGLAKLREICPGLPPNHHGVITEIWDNELLICFDDTDSAAPYPPEMVRKRE